MNKQIIIFKFAAVGDVLRTTAILPGLKEKYPDSKIYWVTAKLSRPILERNPLIDGALLDSELTREFKTSKNDIVINLDEDLLACRLAAELNGKLIGFYLQDGKILCTEKTRYWMSMSLLGGTDKDLLKRNNRKTYQRIMYDIINIPYDLKYRPILRLTDGERRFGAIFAKKNNIILGKDIVIGINTSAGKRWPLKEMSIEKTAHLVNSLMQKNFKVILFGGEKELERNNRIQKLANKGLIDSGCANTLREFAALINICDALISADTLAMHIGIALGKYTIAFFGPTPPQEIEFYSNGEAIVPAVDCICCMKKNACDNKPNCMDALDENIILKKVFEHAK